MLVLRLTSAIEEKILAQRRGRDLVAERAAARIVRDVQRRGDAALFYWTKRFDRLALHRSNVWVARDELRSATRRVSEEFLEAVDHAARNIRAVARRQKPQEWTLEVEPGVRASQRVRPIETVGCYLPGGRFSLVSTLLMTAIPAQEAGVRNIVIVSPQPGDELLAAAERLGLLQIARVGGAQAIAALAYGTKNIPRVDKLFGPGNRFVTAAKQLVSSDCAIDLPAGPTEAVVLASKGNPKWIASDLLAQAEHAPDAGSFLVTTSRKLAREVQEEVQSQLTNLPPDNPAHQSMRKTGRILLAPSLEAACVFCNRFAPEHLSLPDNPDALLEKITAAGTIFLGPWGAQPLGDYVSGSNHVLPTGGWARKRGGLSAADFVKCISVQTISNKGFLRLADAAESLAESEGLLAHRNAVRVRR